jgi:hypothetical protein
VSCINLSSEIIKALYAATATVRYEWFTDWTAAAGADKVKYVLKNKTVSGALTTQLAIQVAECRTNAPDAPATLGSSLTGAGEQTAAPIDITVNTASKAWVRFGVAYSSASEGSATVSLQICLETYGKAVGSTTVSLVAPDTSSYFLPVSEWLPTPMVSKAKAVFAIQQPSAQFQCRMAHRFATTSVQTPSAWSSGDSFHSTGELCTGEIAVTPGSNEMWVQFGIEYRSFSGVNANAIVTFMALIRK